MSNPQQPEVRRSEQTPSQSPDSIKGELEARDRPEREGNTGPVPPGNQPLASSGSDQDQPDLDDFAAKFGIDEADPDDENAAQAAAQTVSADPPVRTTPAASAAPDESTPEDAPTRPGRSTTAHQRSGTDVALDAVGTVVTTGVRLVKPLVGTARELFVNWRQRSSR